MKRVLILFLYALGAQAASVETEMLIQAVPLAGFQYHAGRAVFPLLHIGDRLELVREPDNPHDPRAVRVDWRGVALGYMPRLDNVDLARLLDHGQLIEARIVRLETARDPWKRILIECVIPEPVQ